MQWYENRLSRALMTDLRNVFWLFHTKIMKKIILFPFCVNDKIYLSANTNVF